MSIAPSAIAAAAVYALSEGVLSLRRRAAKHLATGDKGSLPLIWGTGVVSIFTAFVVAVRPGPGNLAVLRENPWIGLVVFCLGLALRWYAISYLGRFFTVNVAIVEDHRVIDSGPYRWLRHPSYTGWLVAIMGLGLCLGNWISLIVLLTATTLIILWRIAIEERVLRAGLGEAYAVYAAKTRRLIPFIY